MMYSEYDNSGPRNLLHSLTNQVQKEEEEEEEERVWQVRNGESIQIYYM